VSGRQELRERDGPHREGEEPKPMMHGHEKSDLAIVAVKPANKVERSAAELVEPRAGTEGNADGKARTGLSARLACHRRRDAYGNLLAVWTRGGSRMRESRTYGSVRGARGNSRPYREVRQPQAGAIQPVRVRSK